MVHGAHHNASSLSPSIACSRPAGRSFAQEEGKERLEPGAYTHGAAVGSTSEQRIPNPIVANSSNPNRNKIELNTIHLDSIFIQSKTHLVRTSISEEPSNCSTQSKRSSVR